MKKKLSGILFDYNQKSYSVWLYDTLHLGFMGFSAMYTATDGDKDIASICNEVMSQLICEKIVGR